MSDPANRRPAVPSPYNAATGGVRSREPQTREVTREQIETVVQAVEQIIRAPLDPLWRIQYSLEGSSGVVYIRSTSIESLIAELHRLYTPAIHYTVWQVDGSGAAYGDTGIARARGTLHRAASQSTAPCTLCGASPCICEA